MGTQKTDRRGKLLILGMGLVGNSLLSLVLQEQLFPIENILAADQRGEAFACFDALGGKPENRIVIRVGRENYRQLPDLLGPGDLLAALADGLDSNALLRECLERGISFVSSSDDTFADPAGPLLGQGGDAGCPEQAHFDECRELRAAYGKAATSLLQFGCNPGLVSVLVKKALGDIVREDTGSFVSENRAALLELLGRGDYPALAAALQVRAITETDLDTTETDLDEDSRTLYSTWNVRDFEEEMNRGAVIRVGAYDTPRSALRAIRAEEKQISSYDAESGILVLKEPGKNVRAEGQGPEGVFEGCVIPHEELVSLYEYYSLRNAEGKRVYAPTVLFLYRPCPLALRSLFHAENSRRRLITMEHVRSGGETVGVVLSGSRFRPRYVCTTLAVRPEGGKGSGPTPTARQVAVALLAAIRYILRFPKEGILYPEDPEPEDILPYITPYLPVYSGEI